MTPEGVAAAMTVSDLARLLRQLRRREARQRGDSEWTYRELAAKTGWSLGSISQYFDGKALPPVDRFDALVRLLGASPAEQAALATARDRIEEHRRRTAHHGRPAAAGPVPRQLPVDVSGFTGRTPHLAELDALRAGGRPTAAVVISAVSGTAGVGKTALAVHWSHQVASEFPDGQLYVNLRGFDPGGSMVAAADVVRGFLEAFEVPPPAIPATLDAQAAMYRGLLADKRVLVVLDNARDAEQVRPLLPGSPGSLVLITSRNQLSSLITMEGAHPLTLDLMTPAEARQLLARRLGAERVAAEPQAVQEIITCCARLPLALAIVAARAASHPAFPLSVLAEQLRQAGGRLDVLTAGDSVSDVRAVFSWSYQALRPEAALLFRLFALNPGPDLATPAAASLAGVSVERVRPLLAELAGANLIVEHVPGRYSFHDLLRAYAAEQAHRIDAADQRHAATYRLLDHYLQTAYTAARLLDPVRDPIMLVPPAPGVTAEDVADHGQALGWFTAEHPVLLAAVHYAATTGLDAHAWQLAWTLAGYLDWRGHWHDQAAAQRTALAAARRMTDPSAQAYAHRNLARAHLRLGELNDAHAELRHALDLYRQAGDQTGQADTHLTLGRAWDRQGRHAEALDHGLQALDLYRVVGHKRGQANALNTVGWHHAQLGDHQQAVTFCRQALTLLQEIGDRYGEAGPWDSIGYAQHHLGHQEQAITCFQHALDLFREFGDRYNEAGTLTHLGDTHSSAGNLDTARHAYQQALTILDDLDHPDAEQVRTKIISLELVGLDTSNGTHPD